MHAKLHPVESVLYIIYLLWLAQAIYCLINLIRFRNAARLEKASKSTFTPKTVVIVAIKGINEYSTEFLNRISNQDYPDYRLIFSVESKSDPAYEVVKDFAEVVVAGLASNCAQKVHNILHALEHISGSDQVVAFADSDILPDTSWLRSLVAPLEDPKVGVASTGRWLLPSNNSLASRVASTIHASINTQGGAEWRNVAWGGTMALRTETIANANITQALDTKITDDLCITAAVRKAGLGVHYIHHLQALSPAAFNWKSLFHFARRQYAIVRMCAPLTWIAGALSTATYTIGLFCAVFGVILGNRLALISLIIVFALDFQRGLQREKLAQEIFSEDVYKDLKPSFILEKYATAFWMLLHGIFVWSTLFKTTISWAGRTYRVRSGGLVSKLG
ncbi:MAG: glycosyltransferase family 2 protein [Bdellovibrionota bacterium]